MIAGLTTYNIKDIINNVAHPCIYVFFDTCALLHILKIETHRNPNNVEIFKKYEELYRLIDAEKIIPLASVMNQVELESNFDNIITTFNNKFNETKKDIIPMLSLAKQNGLIAKDFDYNTLSALDIAENLYQKIMEKLMFISERISYDRFALIRVQQGIVPAHKKHEYKDAYIWRTCLDVKSKSKIGDHIFFFTTNTEDFDMKDSKAKEQLLRDCGKKITIVTDIKALIPQIKIKLGLPLP